MTEDELQQKIEKNLKSITNRVLVFSGKGGVGKSTVAANLALGLSYQNMDVGILDVDIHGPNLAKMLGVEGAKLGTGEVGIIPASVNDHLKLVSMSFLLQDPDLPVIWRGPMKMKAIQQFLGDVEWGILDWLVIDSPPGTGDEPLSVAQLIPATGAIIVTTPQEVSLMDSRKAVAFARRLDLKILGIVENMSGLACPHCGQSIDLFKTGGGERIAREMDVPFLGRIPIDPRVVSLGDEGKSILSAHPEAESSRSIQNIVDKVISLAKHKANNNHSEA